MLTAERLRHLLHYNADTGEFRWRVPRKGSVKGGAAGRLHYKGYREICVDGRLYRAHRLAWLYVHGQWPKEEVDHRNLNKADNRIENLREASHAQNKHNVPAPANNKSGFKGVSFHKQRRRWTAQICYLGKTQRLGLFDTPEAAHAAYVEAAQRLHGEFARVS